MSTVTTKTRRKGAPKPSSRKPEDKVQYERFREFAREHDADDDAETFDRKFGRIITSRSSRG